jgi:hypothetical protein
MSSSEPESLFSRWQNKRVHISFSRRLLFSMLLIHVYTKTALILHLFATLWTFKWSSFITVYITDVDVEIRFVDKIPRTQGALDIEMSCGNPCTTLK